MNRVSVITGGGGGMGLATAGIVGRDHELVLCDIRADRLDAAAAALKEQGIVATTVNADVADRRAVDRLVETASSVGAIASVIHTAGVSPSMGGADYVMRTNAVGTLNVNEAFLSVAGPGSAIVNVASMAAYLLPEEMVPTRRFPLALRDADAFLAEMLSVCEIVPEEIRPGLAYAVSKSFVRWYSTAQAERFNSRGIRILSVSPGSTDTEVAELLAFCAGDRAGYLNGTDILNDGGVVASVRERARASAATS